jgi:Ca2+-dependent lipid-binding protein
MPVDSQCLENVGVFLKASGLKKMDTLSNTDAFAVIQTKNPKTGRFEFYGRTEVITDSQNPEWHDQFTMEYRFEEKQDFVVQIYDKDGANLNDLSQHQLCGKHILIAYIKSSLVIIYLFSY